MPARKLPAKAKQRVVRAPTAGPLASPFKAGGKVEVPDLASKTGREIIKPTPVAQPKVKKSRGVIGSITHTAGDLVKLAYGQHPKPSREQQRKDEQQYFRDVKSGKITIPADNPRLAKRQTSADRASGGGGASILAFGSPATGGIARVVRGQTVAAAKHPGKTAQGIAEQVTGTVGAAGQVGLPLLDATGHIVTGHPKKAAKDVEKSGQAVKRVGESFAKDYKYRYGPALRGDYKTFDKRAEENPAAGVTDIALAAAGGAKVLLPATRGVVKALPGGKAFLETPRPKLRISGGEATTQTLSKKPLRVALQRAEDRRRTKVAVKRAQAPAGERPALQPAKPKVKLGAKMLPPPAEVVPISGRLAARQQRIAVSRQSAKAYIGNKHEQARELNQGAEKAITGLSHRQRDAVFHVTQGLIPVHGTLEQITTALKDRRKQLTDAKAPKGAKVLRPHTELATIDRLLKNPEKVFGDGKLRAFHEAEVARGKRVAQDDPALRSATQEARRHRPQGEMLGEEYKPPAATAGNALERDAYNASYVKRVQEKASAKDLPEPAYFQHAKRPTVRRASRTSGNASKAVKGPSASGMELFNAGRAVTSPHVYVQGLADTIKRKHQWQAVADVAHQHAFGWSTGKHGEGMKIEDLRKQLDTRGIRHGDVTFINFGLFRKVAEGLDNEKAVSHKNFEKAVSDAVQPAETAGDHLLGTRGYVAVPKEVGNELLASTRPSGKGARVGGKLQGMQSAAILGLNPSWLQMQVAANTLQTAAGTGGRLDMVPRAQRIYNRLSSEQKRLVDEHTGVGVYEGHTQTPRLGSQQGRVAKAFEDVGQIPVVRTKAGVVRVTDANPMHAMFRLDTKQNAVFRRAVLFNELRKAQKSLAKVTPKLKGDKRAQLNAVLDNPEIVEQAARHVDAVLGDYLRYTATERRLLKPTLMFYGFLRYATKTLFYTLPVHHPLTGAIALKLGQLHNEDVRRIFGTRSLPPWVFSRTYEYDEEGHLVKDSQGRPQYRDLARINPLSSVATDVVTEGPGAAFGLVSPLVQAAADVVANKNIGQHRPLRIHGSAEEPRSLKPVDIARVFGNQLASSTLPGRYAVAHQKGTPGDDALPFSPRPIRYKTIQAQSKDIKRGLNKQTPTQALFPLFAPRADTTQGVASDAQTAKALGVTVRELRLLRKEAGSVSSTPAVSQREVDVLKREQQPRKLRKAKGS